MLCEYNRGIPTYLFTSWSNNKLWFKVSNLFFLERQLFLTSISPFMQAWSPSPFFSPRRGWLLRAKRNLYYYFKMQETTFSQTRIYKRTLSKENKAKVITEHSMSTLIFTKEIYFLNSYQSCFTGYFFRLELVSLHEDLILWQKFGSQVYIPYF